MTIGNPPPGVVGGATDRVYFPPTIEFIEKIHSFLDCSVHIGGKQRAESCLFGTDLAPVDILADQRLGRTIIGEDGQVVVSGIVAQKGKNGIVTLPPVRSVDFMVGIDFDAVVEVMPLSSESVDQELRPVFPMQLIALGKKSYKKIF